MSEPNLEAFHYVKNALPTSLSSPPTQTYAFVDLQEELLAQRSVEILHKPIFFLVTFTIICLQNFY